MSSHGNELNIIVENENVPIYVTKEEYELFKNAKVVENVRNTYAYKKWSTLVKKSSNFTCECCKSKENLASHHFLSFKYYIGLRLDLKNGICLCSKCHNKYHSVYKLENTSPYTLFKFIEYYFLNKEYMM